MHGNEHFDNEKYSLASDFQGTKRGLEIQLVNQSSPSGSGDAELGWSMSNRTGLRLQLLRDQVRLNLHTIDQVQPSQTRQRNSDDAFAAVFVDCDLCGSLVLQSRCSFQTMQRDSGQQQSGRSGHPSAPIIISQPIKFTGNKIVHLPPQIIHVSFLSTPLLSPLQAKTSTATQTAPLSKVLSQLATTEAGQTASNPVHFRRCEEARELQWNR